MYGAVRSTLRTVGVLKACRYESVPITSYQPLSGSTIESVSDLGTPMTSASLSVYFGGVMPLNNGTKWHVAHLALPINRLKPSTSSSVNAPSSPRMYWSNLLLGLARLRT